VDFWRPLFADERGEDLHHGWVVSSGIVGHALQRVDAADAHFESVISTVRRALRQRGATPQR